MILPSTASGEQWKLIPLRELNKRYYISSFGQIYDTKRKIVMIPRGVNCNGYRRLDGLPSSSHYYEVLMLVTNLKNTWVKRPDLRFLRKTYMIHRLVALAFLGLPKRGCDQVDHIDHNSLNNKIYVNKSGKVVSSNLRWCSKRDNTRKLSNKQAWKIINLLYKNPKEISDIATSIGVDRHLVANMKTHNIWLDLKKKFNNKIGENYFSIQE